MNRSEHSRGQHTRDSHSRGQERRSQGGRNRSRGESYYDDTSAGTAPRVAAAWALQRILEDGAFLDRIITDLHRRAGPDGRDQNLAEIIVKTALEQREQLDELLAPITKGFDRINSRLRSVLYVGAVQIVCLSGVPVHAAVSETVNATREFVGSKSTGLVNAVLRRIIRERDGEDREDLVGDYRSDEDQSEQDRSGSLNPPSSARPNDNLPKKLPREGPATPSAPDWLIARFTKQYGASEARELAEALVAGKLPVFARINTARTDVSTFCQRCQRLGVDAVQFHPQLPHVYALELNGARIPSALLEEGLMTIQDPSAILVGFAVNPLPGERILDMCSAPGGKATHIAELLQGTGVVVAEDVHAGRLALVAEHAERLHLKNIHCDMSGHEHLDNKDGYDKILLDAPCSGSGVLGKKRDALIRKAAQQLEELVAVQRELLDEAAERLRAGGMLIYSTCSLDAAENEEQVTWFLKNHQGWLLERVPERIPSEYCSPEGFLKVLPHKHLNAGYRCAGGFAACLRKPAA